MPGGEPATDIRRPATGATADRIEPADLLRYAAADVIDQLVFTAFRHVAILTRDNEGSGHPDATETGISDVGCV